MPRRARFAVLLLVALAAPACRGCDTAAETGAAASTIPASLRVPVELDGAQVFVLDAARLEATKPDFVEGEHRSWRLRALLGELGERPGLTIEVEGRDGPRTAFPAAPEPDGREVVFGLNREGNARVGLAQPSEPFPPFHGRGGNRGRGGEPGRARDVTKILLSTKPSEAKADAGAKPPIEVAVIDLAITIDGEAKGAWKREDLAKVPALAVPADDGEGTREVWPLRELTAALVGPGARLVSVTGDEGRTLVIHTSDWDDKARSPALRASRRGALKLVWMGADGKPGGGEELRGVTALGFRRGP